MYSNDEPLVKYRKDYQASQFLISKTDLEFLLFDDHVIVKSELDFYRNPIDNNENLLPLILDGIDLSLIDILIDGKNLTKEDYQVGKENLIINNPSDQFRLTTTVKIYPQDNTSLEGLYTSNGKFCTQCEAEGFRKITYYLDRPEVMSEFFVRVEGNKKQYPLLLSNGNPTERGKIGDDRHYVSWHDPFKKPSYLFALVAGDLDCLESEFITMNDRKIKLQLFVDKGKLDQCQFAMNSLVRSMRWDEGVFGREYDLDLYMIVAVGDFNMGAMENKGLNIFNTAYVLANKNTATDSDFEGVERVIAHEYFHNWTGNRVTCRDWFQLSLKEGLTVFRDQKFSEDMQSAAVERIDQVKIIRSAQFAEDSGPMAHPIRPDSYIEMNNFYTVTVYNKGAEVIRMMHTMLGEQGFRSGMDLYFERHDGQAVTCEDFIVAMEDANKVDWQLFRNWYRQAGTPTLEVKFESITDDKKSLIFSQNCPTTPDQPIKKPFMIPVRIGFLNDQGEPLKFKSNIDGDFTLEELLLVKENQQSFEILFEESNENIIPSLLRAFTAPVKLEYDYTVEQLACLFANDTETFNRWDAGQKLMSRVLLSEQSALDDTQINCIVSTFEQVLKDQQLDNYLKALAVQLPDLNSLIGQKEAVNLDQLFSNYRQLKKAVATKLESQWKLTYENLHKIPFADQFGGDRRLKNTALGYLMLADEDLYANLANEQQATANGMTDEVSGLQLLAKSKSSLKEQSLKTFYDKWKDEDLVIDKWFAAQTLSDRESIINDIEELLTHDAFSIQNPNRVRAVIGSFVGANVMQFHNSTGAGYELLTKMIVTLNGINPQIAAKLSKYFGQWKKFDDKRQALITDQLETIRSTENLAKDIYEVVSRYLEN